MSPVGYDRATGDTGRLPAEGLVDLVERELGGVDENEPFRAEIGDLPRDLRTDAAAYARDQHDPARDQRPVRSRLSRMGARPSRSSTVSAAHKGDRKRGRSGG